MSEQPFFHTPESRLQLDREARSWTGTPFVPHAMVKGAGADCLHLVAGIYLNLGVLKKFDEPRYALDEGRHHGASRMLAWFHGREDFIAINPVASTAGDALLMRLPMLDEHLGLRLSDDGLIHALPGRFAMVSSLRETFYSRRVVAAFRPVRL